MYTHLEKQKKGKRFVVIVWKNSEENVFKKKKYRMRELKTVFFWKNKEKFFFLGGKGIGEKMLIAKTTEKTATLFFSCASLPQAVVAYLFFVRTKNSSRLFGSDLTSFLINWSSAL